MLELSTKAFGTIEVNPSQMIRFEDGLLGFHDYREFALLDENEDSPFQWLQSTEESSLAFVVIDPGLFVKTEYLPVVTKGDLEALGVSQVKECRILVIVTIPENHPEKMTANLQGPLLVNQKLQKGRQVISTSDAHMLRYPILEQMEG